MSEQIIWCACGDGYAASSYGAGLMDANNGVCANCDAALHPLQQTLRDNGELVAAQATIAQQAQMIEHLRGGPTPLYTAVDMANAAADGFRDGAASLLPVLEMARSYVGFEGSDAELAQLEAAIIAAGGSVKK